MPVYRASTKNYGKNYKFQRIFDSNEGVYWITIFTQTGRKIVECKAGNSEDDALSFAQSTLSQIVKARKEIVPV